VREQGSYGSEREGDGERGIKLRERMGWIVERDTAEGERWIGREWKGVRERDG